MFEWDEQKNQANLKKHGISFEKAVALWEDEEGVELELIYVEEPRTLRIASIEKVIWSAIFTMRGKNIRLISVRRARDNERAIYEK
jgi:uncharacterized DUF497 family protein